MRGAASKGNPDGRGASAEALNRRRDWRGRPAAGRPGRAGGRLLAAAETAPRFERQQGDPHENELADVEGHEPKKGFIDESIRVQADAEHVDAEPRKTGDNVAENRHRGDAAVFNQAAPAGMEDDRVPDHDDDGAVLLGVPPPEAAPRLVRPDAA